MCSVQNVICHIYITTPVRHSWEDVMRCRMCSVMNVFCGECVVQRMGAWMHVCGRMNSSEYVCEVDM